MPRQSIEEITIGGNPKGRFNGGYIYGLKFDLGYSQNLDKITINVVDGSRPSLGGSVGDITVGNTSYKDCYLLSFEENKSPGQNICNVTFVSKSHFLDKFYVGLAKRHCDASYIGKDGKVMLYPGFRFGAGSYTKVVECPSCNGEPRQVEGNISRVVIDGGAVFGKTICMAGEQPPDNGCDIPEIYYSIGEFSRVLREALSRVGVKVSGAFSFPEAKVNYVGSLREVLSNIANDTGYDFYFDWTTNFLIIYSLRSGISIGASENNSTSASVTRSESLENTYAINTARFGFKPGGSLSYTTSYAKNLTFTHGSKVNGLEDYFVGAVWGKIDANARKLYYMKKGQWNRIGLIDLQIDLDPDDLIKNGFSVKTYIDFNDKFKALGVRPVFKFFIEDTKLETLHQEKESFLLDNYGRYFYSTEPFPEAFENCNNGRKIKVSTEYDPDISLYEKGKYYIDKEPTFCPRLEDFTFNGNIEEFFPVYMDYAGQLRLAVLNALSLSAGANLDAYANQGRLLFALMPRPIDLPIYGDFGELNSEKNNCEEQISNGLYFNKNTTEEEDAPLECKGPCETSAQSEICNKNIENCGSQIVNLPGHKDNRTKGLILGYGKTKAYIKLPVISDFYGIEIKKAEISSPTPNEVISPGNDMKSPENTLVPMKYQLNTDDLSSYMNSQRYPPSTEGSVTSTEKTLNIKVIGIKNMFSYPLSPMQGLSSISMYIDENGSFADLSYRSRAPKLPSKEIAIQSIRPNKVSIRN